LSITISITIIIKYWY